MQAEAQITKHNRSRISARFAELAANGRKALIPYITVGDPSLDATLDAVRALVAGGADVLELGVPFSDPMADGPVIQAACERALANGVTLCDVLSLVRSYRQEDDATPIVLMGYLNPAEVYGYAAFVKDAAAAGVDGLLLVDMPPEEAEVLEPLARAEGLDLVFLLSPTTTIERAERICAHGSGYVYYVSLKGVTGSGNLQVDEVRERVEAIRGVTDLPVGVGFGISDRDSAQAIAAVSDGVVIGSALISLMHEALSAGRDPAAELQRFVAEIRTGLDELAC